MLPVHSAFRETHAIERLRATLRENDARADTLVEHWQRVLRGELAGEENERVRHPIASIALAEEESTAEWMGDIWQPLRKRMNAQKWTHAAYQHVDGTSVSTAVISSVAAQMVQANSALLPAQIKELLCATALDLPALPGERRGAGVIQPARAVAEALRAPAGRLVGYPHSASPLSEAELRKWRDLLTIALPEQDEMPPTAPDEWTPVYFGLLAPNADAVAWVGEPNGWRLEANLLRRGRNGWWQIVLLLPPGSHAYRFCVRTGNVLHWCADPESTQRVEGGYQQPNGDHSIISL
jgi:serine protease AprX